MTELSHQSQYQPDDMWIGGSGDEVDGPYVEPLVGWFTDPDEKGVPAPTPTGEERLAELFGEIDDMISVYERDGFPAQP